MDMDFEKLQLKFPKIGEINVEKYQQPFQFRWDQRIVGEKVRASDSRLNVKMQ